MNEEQSKYSYANTGNLSFSLPENNTIAFYTSVNSDAVLKLDKDGFTYKGERIQDAGKAHAAFLETLSMMKKANDSSNTTSV